MEKFENELNGFKVKRININDIVINEHTRDGCSGCSGIRHMMCPLEKGYAIQKSIKESKAFISGWDFAYVLSIEIPNEQDKEKCKGIYKSLIEAENIIKDIYGDALAFRLPLICPFCEPEACILEQGICNHLEFYRPPHEEYNIDVVATLKNSLKGNIGPFIFSIVLIKQN